MRNWLYDRNILRSSAFGLPLICVGNLSAGGTGKSPMVEYLVNKLNPGFRVATLSRGYKRKTRGYALANDSTTALEIGDEPMQFHLKFPGVPVAVGESRQEAIAQLLHDRPDTELIILDDAFQHRQVRAGLNILLTDKQRLYTRDFYLPAGLLRDQKKSARRAHLLVVTKCEPTLSREESQEIQEELSPRENQEVYFTTLVYGEISHILQGNPFQLDGSTRVLLITGIANPVPLQQYVSSVAAGLETLHYNDHHIYTIDDLKEIRRKFEEMEGRKIILTTEKDSVRLHKFQAELAELPLYVIPVKHHFLFGEEEKFLQRICRFAEEKKQNKEENNN